MADMTRFAIVREVPYGEAKLRRHLAAMCRNKPVMAAIFRFLTEDPPNASAASEALEELPHSEQIAIWSVSTKDGGIWETWERDALKHGDLNATNSYSVWAARNNRCQVT